MDEMMNIDTIIKHLAFFTTKLPHRGSTTRFEKQAAEYAYKELIAHDYKPVIQPFKSAISIYYPALLFGIGMLYSIFSFVVNPSNKSALLSIGIIIVSLINILLDSALKTNIFFLLLPKRESQNIIAHLSPQGQKKQTLVLIGHLDSHRTPLLFSSPFWVRILKLLVPMAIACSLVTCILIFLYIISNFVFSYLLVFFGIIFFIFILLMGQADLTPYTTGANDNASGAATVLAFAEYFKKRPLNNTELYFVLSGCEEVGAFGARVFAHEYKKYIPGAYWFTLDGLGASESVPAILATETFLVSIKSNKKLMKLAKETRDKNPNDEAFILPEFRGAYTDSSPGGMAGFKVISLVALKKNGDLPAWHTLSDNFQNVDRQTLQKCVNFTLRLIEKIDSSFE